MKLLYCGIVPWLLVFYFSPPCVVAQDKPIALDPQNPHYFLFHDKPTVLITSAEHYGAVVNLDFDYQAYLEELHSKGLNLTRLFSGVYIEPPDAFNIVNNTLAPATGRFICPWIRSAEPGYANGGHKFDLTQWDEKYFTRLKSFMTAAQQKDIVVELAFFCPFYEKTQWKLSPMNAINNINGMGTMDRQHVYTLDKQNKLLQVQEALVRKIVHELEGYDNLIYEICNEPYAGNITLEWQHHIASVIAHTEHALNKHHLITQNIANDSKKIMNPDSLVSVFNFHYGWGHTVAENYQLNKVIGVNETGFRGNSDSTYRREGWEFMLAGGGLFNNLDYSFTVGHEKGSFVYPSGQPGGGSSTLRDQLSYLKHFIERFDFTHMRPDTTLITGGLPEHVTIQVLSEPGKQYAVYINGGHHTQLDLNLPAGAYAVEWLNPVTGKYQKDQLLQSSGKTVITPPEYQQDISFRLINVHDREAK